MDDGHEYWHMHAGNYIKQLRNLARERSEQDGHRWNKKRKIAMIGNYRPEMDISDKLRGKLATRYQQMIGILRWSK